MAHNLLLSEAQAPAIIVDAPLEWCSLDLFFWPRREAQGGRSGMRGKTRRAVRACGVAWVALGLRANAALVVIDTFMDGEFYDNNITTSPYTRNQTGLDPIEVLGGERYLQITKTPPTGRYSVSVADGIFTYGAINAANGVINLVWGNSTPLNADFSDAYAGDLRVIRIGILQVDHDEVTASLQLTTGSGTDSALKSLPNNTLSGEPYEVWFNLDTDFSGIDLTDVDQITLTINAPQNGTDVLLQFLHGGKTPEPQTLSLLFLGALLLRRRRRSARPAC
jgi:hypothetical protein